MGDRVGGRGKVRYDNQDRYKSEELFDNNYRHRFGKAEAAEVEMEIDAVIEAAGVSGRGELANQLRELRIHYGQMLAGDRERQARDEALLQEVDRLDRAAATMARETERLRQLREEAREAVRKVHPDLLERSPSPCPRSRFDEDKNMLYMSDQLKDIRDFLKINSNHDGEQRLTDEIKHRIKDEQPKKQEPFYYPYNNISYGYPPWPPPADPRIAWGAPLYHPNHIGGSPLYHQEHIPDSTPYQPEHAQTSNIYHTTGGRGAHLFHHPDPGTGRGAHLYHQPDHPPGSQIYPGDHGQGMPVYHPDMYIPPPGHYRYSYHPDKPYGQHAQHQERSAPPDDGDNTSNDAVDLSSSEASGSSRRKKKSKSASPSPPINQTKSKVSPKKFDSIQETRERPVLQKESMREQSEHQSDAQPTSQNDSILSQKNPAASELSQRLSSPRQKKNLSNGNGNTSLEIEQNYVIESDNVDDKLYSGESESGDSESSGAVKINQNAKDIHTRDRNIGDAYKRLLTGGKPLHLNEYSSSDGLEDEFAALAKVPEVSTQPNESSRQPKLVSSSISDSVSGAASRLSRPVAAQRQTVANKNNVASTNQKLGQGGAPGAAASGGGGHNKLRITSDTESHVDDSNVSGPENGHPDDEDDFWN